MVANTNINCITFYSGTDPYELSDDDDEDEPVVSSVRTPKAATPKRKVISADRLSLFKSSISKMFQETHSGSATMDKLRQYVAQKHAAQPFSANEIAAAIERLTDDNHIMVSDGIVFLI